jgi:hypothetical protein
MLSGFREFAFFRINSFTKSQILKGRQQGKAALVGRLGEVSRLALVRMYE